MTIELHVEPRKVYTWKDFRRNKPAYSIGLDGIVDSPTRRDPKGPYANFDHHSKSGFATRSTSGQVHMEIRMGLFQTFKQDEKPHAHVYVNDPDEDVCLAWWLLNNSELVNGNVYPQITGLVDCEDRMDCTAGAYPLDDPQMRRQMAWIFDPYNLARFEGKIATATESEMRDIINTVEGRITDHVFGRGKEIQLEGHFERIGGDERWALTRETGPASRMAMYNNGIRAFIAVVAQKADGSFVYAIGKRDPWNPIFQLPLIYRRLNREENGIITKTNRWGGSDFRGGSPKETGSGLPPKRVEEIVISELNKVA